jgi:enoyl-CoA hydratase/carnithine racemase
MSISKDIQLEIDGEVAVVRLNRPAKRNALSDGILISVVVSLVKVC